MAEDTGNGKDVNEKGTGGEEEEMKLDLNSFLLDMRLNEVADDLKPVRVSDLDICVAEGREYSNEVRLASALNAMLVNLEETSDRLDKRVIQAVIKRIDTLVNLQLNEVIHHDDFRQMESVWRSLNDLIANTNMHADIMIDFIDVTKGELFEDFETNAVDITNSSLFKKVYVAEYDQYGGKPYGGIMGLYDFRNIAHDKFWLETMGKVAAASHAPFIGTVSPEFFGCRTIEELSDIQNLAGLMNQPKYSAWDKFRDSEEAAYIGLSLPRYMVRPPYHPELNPCGDLNFEEKVYDEQGEHYLWGHSSLLFTRNMTRSFEESGWCQYLRGPKGGGMIKALPVHVFNNHGENEMKLPVEMAIPDYRELEFAQAGFIPLIYRKGFADACFFSCQSIKKPKKFKDPQDSENSQLVTNLSYTFSVTRIAHYIKCMMRDDIGSPADKAYIQNKISNWLNQYITTVVDPDDLTLRYYPFKAVSVEVMEREGMIGWYDCKVKILPHIQFEGMDVELSLDVRI